MQYVISVLDTVATVTVTEQAEVKVNDIADALYKMDKHIDVVDVYDENGEWLVTQFRKGR